MAAQTSPRRSSLESATSVTRSPGNTTRERRRTWWQALLELLSLVWVVEGEGVKVSRAPDFELGLGLAAGRFGSDLFYPGLCRQARGKDVVRAGHAQGSNEWCSADQERT